MANNIDYQRDTERLMGSTVKSFGWGIASGALGLAGLAVAGSTLGILALPLFAGAIFSGVMQWKMEEQKKVVQEDINAQRTATYIEEAIQRRQARHPEYPENQRADGRQWADIAAEKKQSQAVTK